MTKNELSRRAMLGALASLPALVVAGAAAGTREEFSAGLARKPQLMGFATARAEVFNASMTTLRGYLPSDLTGVLWRNGPAEHERFGHRYGHWFDGDGMVQAFALSGDKVTHRARILDTPKRRRETQAGKRIMPAFATPGSEPLMGPDDMNVANTAMLVHAGRLMALWEGGSALAVDPETLDAGRFVVWHPDLAGLPFSAHPKVEKDGTLWNIGFVTQPRPALLFYRIDRSGQLIKANLVDAGPLGMVHDFVVTGRHLVVLLTPFVVEPERWSSGHISFLDAHVWRPGLGTRVLTIGKDTLEPVRRHELPPGFHFHHGNGWEEPDGTIRLDLCQAPNPDFVTEDLRVVMRGEIRFPSTHPRYGSVVLSPRGGAAIELSVPGALRIPPHRSTPYGTAPPEDLRSQWQRFGRQLAVPASCQHRSRTGRDRWLDVPARSNSRGARVRAPRRGRGRRLADRSVPRCRARSHGTQRVRCQAHLRGSGMARHSALSPASWTTRHVCEVLKQGWQLSLNTLPMSITVRRHDCRFGKRAYGNFLLLLCCARGNDRGRLLQ